MGAVCLAGLDPTLRLCFMHWPCFLPCAWSRTVNRSPKVSNNAVWSLAMIVKSVGPHNPVLTAALPALISALEQLMTVDVDGFRRWVCAAYAHTRPSPPPHHHCACNLNGSDMMTCWVALVLRWRECGSIIMKS